MAVTIDGSVLHGSSTTSSITVSLTVGNNSQRLLLVTYGNHQGGDATSITFNGLKLQKIYLVNGSFSECVSVYGMVAPAITTANIVCNKGSGNFGAIGIYSLYNVRQILPYGFIGQSHSTSSESLTLYPTSDNNMIIDVIESEASISSFGGSQTSDFNLQGQSYENVGGSHQIISGARANTTFTVTLGSGQRTNHAMIAVEPYYAEPIVPNKLKPAPFAP